MRQLTHKYKTEGARMTGNNKSLIQNFSGKQSMCGAGLIEVMVALFVLAIGLLGVLGMQTLGVQSNRRAEHVSFATFLATEMVQMISAHDAFADKAQISDRYGDLDSTTISTSDVCSAECTRGQQPLYDAAQWADQLQTLLPGGEGTVTFENGVYTVTIYWDSEGVGSANLSRGETCNGDPETEFACYKLEVQI